INVSLLGIVWGGHVRLQDQAPPIPSGMDRPEMTGRTIIRDLDLNQEQRDQFRIIFEHHRRNMDSLSMILREAKSNVNRAIVEGDSSQLQEFNAELFQIQREVELETQNLTRRLAKIATGEQRQKFLNSMDNVLMHQPGMRKRRNGK
ncbi:MAG TPA: hypothetical protein DHN29_18095, partial [Cytophagales bacterium]|nr:hypothetical protein [Cytophagales bacterium]